MVRELGGGRAYGDGGVAAAARARQRGDADEANEGSSTSWQLRCPSDLTGGLGAGVRTPLGARGLRPIGHDGQAKMAIRPPSGA